MGTTKITTAITVGILTLAGIIIYAFESKVNKNALQASPAIKIEKSWEMPKELDEISGMVFLDENRLACIQDEDGIIFIYNLSTSKIENQIEFGDSADYEGIAFSNTTAYIATGDGKILIIENFHRNPSVTQFETPLSSKHDVESLFFDNRKNQLLTAVKENDPNSEDFKGIYSFNLNTYKLNTKPVYQIDMNHEIFNKLQEDNPRKRFKPSDIAIHPKTHEIFSVEGTNPKLLILNKEGKINELHVLNRDDFPQPEGLAFDPEGTLYISSEGNPGLIHKVSYK